MSQDGAITLRNQGNENATGGCMNRWQARRKDEGEVFSRPGHRAAKPTAPPPSPRQDEGGGVGLIFQLQAVDENTSPSVCSLLAEAPFTRQAVQDQWWKLLSSCSQAPPSGISSGVVAMVNVPSFGLVGGRSDALALHEAITCAVSMPKLLDTCFVMQDWCRALRLMRWPFVREHIYRVRM